MDFENKLEELNMTPDEINHFTKAMKNEKFRELLHEYAEEISNPENKKKYEEEITQLEQERGMEVKFIHPSPHHVLKTSVNGKEKCFINICSNNLINKPTCEARANEQGQVGQCWSLPYSLTPGRPDRDSRGNKCMIYDVVFHPDTLYMAGKNTRFMKLVNRTATQGVETAFKVTPDKAYKLLKKIQYKGVPQPAVIRKPIPGQPRNKESSSHDGAYPDTMPIENPALSLPSLTQSSVKQSSSLPIQPHYMVKYRSFVDLQDYRCSRDSAPSPRPKEIIITIDLPLLKTAADIDLNVSDRNLTLASRKPNYKLELKLSYPVDSDKGEAKFNKATKELVITLAVQPAKNPAVGYIEGNQSESDDRDLMKNPDKPDEAQHDAELVTEQTEQQNFSDTCSEAQPQENRPEQEEEKDTHLHSNEKITSLESESNPLHLADATPTPEINHTDTSRSSENAMNMPKHGFLPSSHICTHKMSVKLHANEETGKDNLLSGTKSVQHSAMAPAVKLEDFTQFSLMDGTENGSPLEVPAMESQIQQAATHVDETLQDVRNNPANTSNWLMEKTEVPVISDGPTQLNSPLDKDNTNNSCEVQVIKALSKEENSCSNLSSTLMQLNEQMDSADSSKQTKTNITMTTPAILREKNPEDSSEVIIVDQTTSVALSFQNSLWFELD
ncbi:protein kintoun [Clarias gariepinus]